MTRSILISALGLSLTALALSTLPASAQIVTLAADNAANYSSYTLLTTQNGGTGFSGPFTASGSGGFFLGNSTANGFNDGPGINSSGVPAGRSAFGIYSNETVQRTLSAPLKAGDTFSLGYDNGFIDNGFQQVGIGTAGNNTLVEFGFQGGRGNYLFNFNESDLGYTSGGLNVAFTLTSATSYTLTATRLNDNATASVAGTLPDGTSIDTLTFLNNDSGSGPSHDFYVNNLAVNGLAPAPEPSAALALTLGALGLGTLALRARRRTA